MPSMRAERTRHAREVPGRPPRPRRRPEPPPLQERAHLPARTRAERTRRHHRPAGARPQRRGPHRDRARPGTDPLIVRDNGIGLSSDDMRELLSMIGGTNKRDDFAMARRNFLGQFGIGLLSGFLVADSIEVVSRSARVPDAPTVRWVGSSDGTFTIRESATPLPEPGTEVRLHPRYRAYRWCESDAVLEFASDF